MEYQTVLHFVFHAEGIISLFSKKHDKISQFTSLSEKNSHLIEKLYHFNQFHAIIYETEYNMLIQFRFKNYKSFKDETILDMTATKGKEYSSQIVESGYEKILPAAAILGANASGKTNLIRAFSFMSFWVLRSYTFNADSEFEGDSHHPYFPFSFNMESMNGPSEFEVFFSVDNEGRSKVYNYGFVIDRTTIQEEWLNVKKTKYGEFRSVFYREGNSIDNDHQLGNITPFILKNINNNVLTLSLTKILNIESLSEVFNWFSMNTDVIFDPERTAFEYRTCPAGFDSSPEIRKNVVKFLSTFDSSIKDFTVKTQNDENGHITYDIKALHEIKGSDQLFPISLEMESSGTQKMFALYKYLVQILKQGSVLMIDELDSRLHPLLVRLIVNTFINRETNPNNAQIVFTTHDSWQLISNQLRRDELWFTDKNQNQESILYSLSEFRDDSGDKIRKDESLQKNYMLGKYGAIPELQPLTILQE